ncbi:MAG: AI-2E family transporter [Anaerolineae bacterium]|nr:AI-2E family transporter [Anaerolineae bacterium]
MKNSSSIMRLLMLGAGVVVIIAGLKMFADVVSPAIMAGFLALLCVPLYQWLQRKGLGSGLALLVMILLLLGIFVGLAWLVVSSFSVLLQTLPEYTANMQAEIATIADKVSGVLDAEQVQSVGNGAVSLLADIAKRALGTAVSLVVVALIVIVLLVFIIAESSKYPARLKRGLGETNELLPKVNDFRDSLINYFVARIKVNTITGIGVLIMLSIAGVDYALLWAVLAIFMSFIPYFGLVIAAIPAVVLAFAQFGLPMAVAISLGYLIINQIIEQVVAPKIIADDISLSPALTFFALFFWGWVFSFLGVLLAAPLTVLTVMILQSYPDTRWLAVLVIADDKQEKEKESEG